MRFLFSGAHVFLDGQFFLREVLVEGGVISQIGESIPENMADQTLNCDGLYLIPGLADVHVHLREPGFSYKETIASGTKAAAAGGFSAVCAMPNLDPPPDCAAHLNKQLELIEKGAVVRVYPYGCLTINRAGRELSDIGGMSPYVAGFSDDGSGVQDRDVMRRAMLEAARCGRPVAAHCEDNSLLEGGYIHKGAYSKAYGHRGIPSESEWRQIERDIAIAAETGCHYHVCHLSTKEGVWLIRKAKESGIRVTCETAPHYLTLCDEDMRDEGRYKMNPPIRGRDDRDALIEGLRDGVIDIVATDHAPHSAKEKEGGLSDSIMGIVGLETAFPVMYTKLVKTGVLSLERLIHTMCVAPRDIFSLPGGSLRAGEPADIALFDLSACYTIDSSRFYSMGRSTPFEGLKVWGQTVLTMVGGRVIFRRQGGEDACHGNPSLQS